MIYQLKKIKVNQPNLCHLCSIKNITMKKVQILHNPRCGKSREALKLLQAEGCDIEIIEYLKKIPTKKELKDILSKLGLKALEIVRQKEGLFIKKFKGKKFTNEEWIQILIENPILIERPIVIDGYKAIIARPPDLASDLINRINKL
jgi:arsenate reductase